MSLPFTDSSLSLRGLLLLINVAVQEALPTQGSLSWILDSSMQHYFHVGAHFTCAIMLPLSHWGCAHKVRSYMSSLDKTGLSKTVRGGLNLSQLIKA